MVNSMPTIAAAAKYIDYDFAIMRHHTVKFLADEILEDCSQNRQSAKINSPPKFPAIRYQIKSKHTYAPYYAHILLYQIRTHVCPCIHPARAKSKDYIPVLHSC